MLLMAGKVKLAKGEPKEEKKALTTTLVKEKNTSNTVMYKEKTAPGTPPICNNLYLQKWAVGDFEDAPEKITVSIEF